MKKFLLFLALGLTFWNTADACTNIMITRGASRSGSTMVSYTADSHTLYGALYFMPAATHPAGSIRVIREWDTGKILGQIPEVAQTYSVTGNMNEHQVVIGESTWGGREELFDSTGLIDYGSLMYLALQRCRTARQAVEFMGAIVAEFGYASSGESISIADGKEVWYLEIIGKGVKMVQDKKTKQWSNIYKGASWVALRVPDGMISAHANHARITTFPQNDPENCLFDKGMIAFAREKGYFKGQDKDFSFTEAFNPIDFGAARGCEARVWSMFRRACTDGSMEKYEDYALGHNLTNRMPLWIKPTSKLDVKDVAALMRDHYEGTKMDMTKDLGAGSFEMPYRWRPMEFEVDGVKYVNERAISTQQTGWWYVGESRSWLPDVVGGVFWFGVDDTATSPLTPIYSASTRVPDCLSQSNGSMTRYSPTSMFWIQQRVTNFTYTRYNVIFKDVKRSMDRWENGCFAEQKYVDDLANELYKKDPAAARAFVSDYSVATAQRLFQTWKSLDEYLLVKFIDGNIKKESSEGVFIDNGNNFDIPTGPMQPGYSDAWKKMVAGDPWSEILKIPNAK
ncbi:MAG: C69 family dipeptidase [Mucinivorans sp.]